MTVKNFRVSIGLDTNSAGVPGVTWALVYVFMELALIALPLQPDLFMNHHHMLSILVWDLMLDHFVCSVQWVAYFILVIMFIS